MKIYTKKGDKGFTSLFGGKKLSKDHLRIEAYGTVDELNAHIGVLHALVGNDKIRTDLLRIQRNLFDLGAILATDPEKIDWVKSFNGAEITFLEKAIDEMEQHLPQLRNFLLPSGSQAVSQCHVVRTVCRRAERRTVTLNASDPLQHEVIIYLNRLSDYFFVLSRKICQDEGCSENLWFSE